jgi:mycothiol synthase
MDVTWRALMRDDVPALAALLAAAEAVDNTMEKFNEDDLYEEFDDPATGPRDRMGAWYGDELIAYGAVRPRANPATYVRIHAEGTTRPDWRGRGLGTRSVTWTRERAAEVLAEQGVDLDARVETVAFLDNAEQIALLESEGLSAVNWSAVMRVSLDTGTELPEPTWPSGLTPHVYDPSWSVATRDAHNDAFREHWGFLPWSAEMWQQWVDGTRSFRPRLSTVVVDDTEPEVVVGYVQTMEFDAYETATGRREAYLAKLGVRPEHRGRGLATALLRHSLRSYQRAGYHESSLDVDTNNATGAFQLYERVGYAVEKRTVSYVTTVPGPATLAAGQPTAV